jgi:hypothetical protein
MPNKQHNAKASCRFDVQYPNIAEWIDGGGLIEIGPDGYTSSFIRAIDEGGTIWDSSEDYATLDDALRALDDGLKAWVDENL